ncbi:TonB-dependent receptor [Draconibacterium sp. IB214405]|uniref:TonB-dependent receptor domain-containing protein n=1 Tax=Draconibacterium sp. IB214405 TaxID=3097352 RepID=UPI002A164234|nr:TonB-dependent receptor [Draconibacterium sp. IB214405]MDX8340145.1 TonB-dependent receptor [Draconibacterium sp. IB214405]
MKTTWRTITFLLFFTVLLPSGIIRAQLPFSKQDTTILRDEIEEITITAFRSPYNIFNTPAPVNLILPLEFESGDALTPIDALNRVPGILMHHGTLNTNRLTIRGIGSRTPYGTNKIKAYFGEIPLTTGDGETVLEDLENTSIQRLEIIKGPSSSLYGAGLAGVLLFHPKSVEKDFVQNETTVASFGTYKNTLSAGVSTDRLQIYTLGALLSSDGFRENNSTTRGNILLNSTYNFSDKSNLQFLAKATKMKAYIPSSLDLETYQNDPQSAALNWAGVHGYEEYTNSQLGVSFNRFTLNEGKISAGVFGSTRKLDELRPFNRLKESSDYIGWRAYMQKVVTSDEFRLVMTTGIEMFRETYDWQTFDNDDDELLSDNNEKRQYENLFVQVESNIKDRLFISTGLNGNLTRFKYTDHYLDNGDQSGKKNYKPVLSPRLGLNVLLAEEYSLFSNVSHGFSTPTFEETLMPEGTINEDIKPESGWSFETGFRAQFTNRFKLSASYYRIYIDNLLVAHRTGEDAYIGVNAGQSVHPGFEAEFTWVTITHNKNHLLTIYGSTTLANYHFNDFVNLGTDYSGKLLPGTAKETFSLGANLSPLKNLSLNAWYRYNGEMPVDDANSAFSDAFGLTNTEIRYKAKAGAIKFDLRSGVQNIFDINYTSMLAVNAPSFGGNPPRYYYPGNPRNFYFSILIGLSEKPNP